MWVPFNEGWGQYEPARIVDEIKAWDPSRLVNADSGVNCCDSLPGGEGDIYDNHAYAGPGAPAQQGARAAVDGEYGGLGLRVDGHMFDPANGFAYEMEPDAATLTRRYAELQGSCCRSRSGAGSRRPSTPRSPTSRTSSTASTPTTAGCSSPAPTRY